MRGACIIISQGSCRDPVSYAFAPRPPGFSTISSSLHFVVSTASEKLQWNEVLKHMARALFQGDVAQMVERSLSMREALGSMPSFSTFCSCLVRLMVATGESSQ